MADRQIDRDKEADKQIDPDKEVEVDKQIDQDKEAVDSCLVVLVDYCLADSTYITPFFNLELTIIYFYRRAKVVMLTENEKTFIKLSGYIEKTL